VHYDADVMLAVLLLEATRAGAVVVGEDLGTVEDVVTTTMHERGLLSSAVLWFERDWDAPGQPHVPPRAWEPETMASISTHDLPTVEGWLRDERIRVQADLDLLGEPVEDALATAASDREALLALLREEGIDTDDLLVALHAVIAPAASRLPVDLDAFFDHDRVRAAVAPLRAARPTP
jgi:4-alpha-glucanotransferase